MLLVFGDEWLDLREFPDLMPERALIRSAQLRAATSTGFGFHCDDFGAVFCRDELPLVPLMSRLTTAVLLRLRSRRLGLGMRMLGAGRERRVLGRFVEPGFELCDPSILLRNPGQQQPNDHLRFRRLTGNQVFGDL